MRSGQLSNMHRPRFAYACRRRQHSLGPETRNPNAHYCTLSGRNHIRPRHVFKMLADSILIANGSSAKARVALRNRLSESAVQHWNENAYRLRACRTQQLAIYLRACRLRQQRPACGRQQHPVPQAASHNRHQASTKMLGRLWNL